MTLFRGWMVLLAFLLVPAALAHRAVVVGVANYKQTEIRRLKGPVNDALAVGDFLKSKGFDVTILKDGDAKGVSIVAALEEAKRLTKPTEQFVFYFAGHGRNVPAVALMPWDADLAGTRDLLPKRLSDLVEAIQAQRRTIILDACFSGGMPRSLTSEKTVEVRHFQPAQSRSGFGPANRLDTLKHLAQTTKINYFAASLASERAIERMFTDGKVKGVFTEALLRELPIAAGKATWGDVCAKTRLAVTESLRVAGMRTTVQTPILSPLFNNDIVLGDGRASRKVAESVAQLVNYANPDTEKIRIEIFPDLSVIKAGEPFHISYQAGTSGYLVILSEVGGRFDVYVPRRKNGTFDLDATHTDAMPAPKRITDEEVQYLQEFGDNRIVALLFKRREEASALLEGLDSASDHSLQSLIRTKLPGNLDFGDAMFTSTLRFGVAEELVDGGAVRDPLRLFDSLIKQDGKLPNAIWQEIVDVLGHKPCDEIETIADRARPGGEEDLYRLRGYLSAALNYVVLRRTAQARTVISPDDLDEKDRKLTENSASLDAGALRKLNRQLLSVALRDYLVEAEPAKTGAG